MVVCDGFCKTPVAPVPGGLVTLSAQATYLQAQARWRAAVAEPPERRARLHRRQGGEHADAGRQLHRQLERRDTAAIAGTSAGGTLSEGGGLCKRKSLENDICASSILVIQSLSHALCPARATQNPNP